jgi:branched-chain amino acid aminotransferase
VIEADYVWLSGKLVPFAEAQTHVITFTLHYGLAVFEGVRLYRRADGRTAVFRLREHIARLCDSAKIATLDLRWSAAELEAACLETIRANKLTEGYLRPLAFTGAGALGLGTRENPVEVAIICFPWPPMLGEEGLKNGVRAQISTYVRGHLNHAMSKAKISGGYVSSVLAKREVQRFGVDEAILLDDQGHVAEGTGDNIFIVDHGTLITPPLELPILHGITRDSVLRMAHDMSIPVAEQAFSRDALYIAQEVFLTGTAIELTPVREVDGRTIGSGRPGPITKQLQDAFYAAVRGPGEPYPDWLTFV